MLDKLEMYEIQDKQRLLEEMNETREGVNKAFETLNQHAKELKKVNARVEDLMKAEEKPKPKKKK